MSTTLKIGFTVLVVTICVIALVIGIWLGTRENDSADCNTVSTPTYLSVVATDQTVLLSWLASAEANICDVIYEVEYIQETEKRIENTTELQYEISNVDFCIPLYIHVYAISVFGGEKSEPISKEYTVLPTKVSAVTDIIFTESESQTTITWTKPLGYDGCTTIYDVIVITDINVLVDSAVNEAEFIVAYMEYCYSITAVISAKIKGIIGQNNVDHIIFEIPPPASISVELVEETDLVISWTPIDKQELCDMSYMLTYKIDDNEAVEVLLKTNTYSLDVGYCTKTAFSVISVIEYFNSTSVETNFESATPTDFLPSPSNVLFNEDENNIILTWSSTLTRCNDVRYVVELSSDITSNSVEATVNTLEYAVEESFEYCFSIEGSVMAKFGDTLYSTPTTVPYNWAPRDVNTEVSREEEEIIVSWEAHSNPDLCGISYSITYQTGEDPEKLINDIDENIQSLPLKYCVTYSIAVAAYSSIYDKLSTASTISIEPVNPNDIPEVISAEATFSETEGTVDVSWTIPNENLNLCALNYTVSASTEEYTASCQVTTTSCTISLPSFCPSVTFDIVATMNDIPSTIHTFSKECISSSE